MRRAVVVVALMVAGSATADVGVVVTGEPAMQAPFGAQVRGWLRDNGYPLVTEPLGTDAPMLIDCFVLQDMKCAKEIFEDKSRARSLVFAKIELQPGGGSRELAITAYWFVKKRDAVVDKRMCKRCDEAALHRTVDALMEDLAKSSGLDKGRLEIKTDPPGMVVLLDKVRMGVTPIGRDLRPGSHELVFEHAGRTGKRAVIIDPGGVLEVTGPESWSGGEPPRRREPETPGGSRLVPGLLVGAGVAAFAGGAAFLYYANKGSPEDPFVYTNARPIGTAVTLVGGGVLVAGALSWPNAPRGRAMPGAVMLAGTAGLIGGGWLLYLGSKDGDNEPYVYRTAMSNGTLLAVAGASAVVVGGAWWFGAHSAPTVAVAPNGASIGWTGRF